jgi:hypothetical protein
MAWLSREREIADLFSKSSRVDRSEGYRAFHQYDAGFSCLYYRPFRFTSYPLH